MGLVSCTYKCAIAGNFQHEPGRGLDSLGFWKRDRFRDVKQFCRYRIDDVNG